MIRTNPGSLVGMDWRYSNVGSNPGPFTDQAHYPALASMGLNKAELLKANIIVCRTLKYARYAARLFPRKQVAVWTNEPAFDRSTDLWVPAWPGKPILVCNVFTGHVFWHNRHFLGSYHYETRVDLGLELKPISVGLATPACFERRKRALAVFAHKQTTDTRFSRTDPIDLNSTRQQIALRGHQLGFCEIVGSGWAGLAMEASGWDVQQNEPWWTRKLSMLQNYRFSIALENTASPYYVTEKIWHAVKAGALPVYWGRNSSIYETFPAESFVDASTFSDFDALWNYLKTMGSDEWCVRMERCIRAYNQAIEQRRGDAAPLSEIMNRFLALIGQRF